ncbi:hypothetical protein D3C73_834560 [compost metagenome]
MIPQRLNVIGPCSPWRIRIQVSIPGVHPGLIVIMGQIALIINPIVERAFDAVTDCRIQLTDNLGIPRIFHIIL